MFTASCSVQHESDQNEDMSSSKTEVADFCHAFSYLLGLYEDSQTFATVSKDSLYYLSKSCQYHETLNTKLKFKL